VTVEEIKRRIEDAFERLEIRNVDLPASRGKVYELYVLTRILRYLIVRDFSLYPKLINGSLRFARSPSSMDRNSFSFIELRKQYGRYELWVNLEFIGISGYCNNSPVLPPSLFRKNFAHELDICIIRPNNSLNGSRPFFWNVVMAVECKNTGFSKDILKQVIGVRRELSFLSSMSFMNSITNRQFKQLPPSAFLMYSSDRTFKDCFYTGNFWGIGFKYLPY